MSLKFYEDPVPLHTKRKLNVCKTFRRRPGRLLNVLYTFNSDPVSKGIRDHHIFQAMLIDHHQISLLLLSEFKRIN